MELVESNLRPPWTRPGIVPRTALVERLLAAPAAAIIWVVAPPGSPAAARAAAWDG